MRSLRMMEPVSEILKVFSKARVFYKSGFAREFYENGYIMEILKLDFEVKEIAIEISMPCLWGREGNGRHDRRRVHGLRPVAAKIWAMPGLGGAATGSYRCYGAGSRRKGAHHGWAFHGNEGVFGGILFNRG